MSFTEMMSSGRGPGVIGMVLALIVLIGFGVLFMFAFDEGFQGGGQSIESVIRSQAGDIESTKAQIIQGNKTLALAPGRLDAVKALSTAKLGNKELADRIVKLGADIESGKQEVVSREAAFDAYKDEYRAFVRGKAKGSTLPELKTLDGVLYKNVNIREVTAVGMQIRHDEGQKRIPFENLSEEMKDYYQFDPEQKKDALAKESSDRDQHDAAVAVASDQADEQMAIQRQKDAGKAKEAQLREIAKKEAQISGIRDEIRNLQQEMSKAASEAAAAKSAGRMHINRSSNIGGSIRVRENRISALMAEIAQLRSRP